MSSTAFTSNVHGPAAAVASPRPRPPLAVPGNGTGYVPGACCAGRRDRRRPVGGAQRHRHRRRADDPVAEVRRVVDAVAVRRDARGRLGGEDAAVEERERGRDPPLGPVRGPVEELAVERHRRRAAAVERHPGDRPEADERLRELEVREPDAVAGLPAVDGDEDDPAVAELADGAARCPRAELAGREHLARAEDRRAALDDLRPAADRPDHVGPRRAQPEVHRHRPARDRLGAQRLRGGAARDEHGAARRDRHGARRPSAPRRWARRDRPPASRPGTGRGSRRRCPGGRACSARTRPCRARRRSPPGRR